MTHSSNARLNDNRLDVTGPQQREQDEDHAIRSVGDDATTLEALEADNLPLALTEKLVTSGGSGGNNDDDYDRNVSPAPDANPQQQATSSTGAGAQQTRSNGGLPPHSLRVSFQRQASSSSSSSHHSPATTKSPGYDTQLLHRAVADAGRWAYGIVWVEVWALSADQTHLYRPECGWWIDPRFHHSRCGAKCPVCRLTDPSRLDYVAPQRLSPGQGLPGVLWSEVSSGKAGAANLSWSRSFRETLASRILGTHHHHPIAAHCAAPTEASSSPPPLPPPPPSHPVQVHLGFHLARLHHQLSSRIVWRDVNQIESDPDQPWNPRLRALAGAGLGWVGAVPFHLRQDRRGLVLYLAPNKVDLDRLRSEANESYLLSAGDLIGAAYALRGPRQRLVGERRLELKEALRRVRKKILEIHRNGRTLQEYVEERAAAAQTSTLQKPQAAARHGQDRLPSSPSSPPPSSCADPNSRLASAVKGVGRSASSAVKKTLWGAGPPTIPPAFSWKQTALTFAGSLVTLLAVTTMSDRFVNFWGTEYGIVLGPFGAFMTLLYGLTAAPASQPRNALLGQTASMAIAVSVSCAPSFAIPAWLKQSLAGSLAIAFMVKAGVTHPPAGAAAVLLSAYPRPGWKSALTSLIGNAVAIAIAAVVNNLSNKRQYPIYWGLVPARCPATLSREIWRMGPSRSGKREPGTVQRHHLQNEQRHGSPYSSHDSSSRGRGYDQHEEGSV